jgi:PAS domain S-box-containing protein
MINENFKISLDSAPNAMLIINKKGDILLINKQLEILFGYKKDEMQGEKVEILIPSELKEKHIRNRNRFYEAPRNITK